MNKPASNEDDIAADIMDWIDSFTFVNSDGSVYFANDEDLRACANAIVKHYKMEPKEADVPRD